MAWKVAAKCVEGALHKRMKIECQDRVLYNSFENDVVLAVADGHGSNQSPKSHIGADLAVTSAEKVLREFSVKIAPTMTLSSCNRYVREQIPKSIVKEWRKSVERKQTKNPAKKEKIGEYRKNAQTNRDKESFYVLYGSTLLSILVSERFIYFFQIGDGDIVVSEPDGSISRPIMDDSRLIFNETTSLCLPHAWDDARSHFRVLESHPPSLILAATDGYSNSFKSEEDFIKNISDFASIIRSEGFKYLNDNLENWLTQTSIKGSGDDIGLGIIWNESNEKGEARQ